MDNRSIGVFDSGIGGLTAVKELIKILPNENIVYFGDTARVPYGSRSAETIIEFAKQDLNFLLSKNVKAILVACGTVSATSLTVLQSMTEVPIVGVISAAAKTAVTCGTNLLVLATPATVSSHAYREAIRSLSPERIVYEKACPLFVPLTENGYANPGNPVTDMVVSDYLADFSDVRIDAVILGCTHYPLLKDTIGSKLPAAALIEVGKEAAFELKDVLEERGLLADPAQPGHCEYYVSELTDAFKDACEFFLGKKTEEPISVCKVDRKGF